MWMREGNVISYISGQGTKYAQGFSTPTLPSAGSLILNSLALFSIPSISICIAAAFLLRDGPACELGGNTMLDPVMGVGYPS
jgi:hypothetical protein